MVSKNNVGQYILIDMERALRHTKLNEKSQTIHISME